MKEFPITARHLGRAGVFCAALTMATLIFAGAFVVRLMIGPISLGPFTDQLRSALASALPGLALRFDDAALGWSRDEHRLDLMIMGARIFDEKDRIIAQAPEAEVGLAIGPFLRGKIVVRRIALVGVQLTLVHSKDGVLRLGVGRDNTQNDVLQRIREAIAKSGTGASSLHSFAVTRARLAFYEQETGAFVVAPQASLQVTRASDEQDGPEGPLRANVDANIEISGKPAHITAVLNFPATSRDVTGDISLQGLSTKGLASNSKFFAFLAPFDLNADVSGSFALAHGTQVRSADFGIGAQGLVTGLGKPLHVRSFRIVGRYDGITGRLLIDDATLEGLQARAHMEGTGDLDFDLAGGLTKAALDLRLDKIAFDMPGVLGRSVKLTGAAIRGSYIPSAGLIAIDQAVVFANQLSAKFAGRVVLANDNSPEIDIDGSLVPMAVRDFLHYWPLQIGAGARSWVDENVSTGRVGPLMVHTHIPSGAFDLPAFPDNALSVSFPISGASVSYIRGLTPLTSVSGECFLTGDTFKAQIASASVGPLLASRGLVVIPNLHLHGTIGTISTHIEGSVPDVLALIDQKPLRYPSRFNIRTATAKGTAAFDMAFRVPMLHDLSVDKVGIAIKAQASNLGLALNDRLTISNSNLAFAVDNASLRAQGTVGLAGANVGVDWTEAFKPKGPVSTRIAINGVLAEPVREALGIHATSYISGPVTVSGQLQGFRGKIQRADLDADLSAAALSVKELGFKKPAGAATQAQIGLELDQNDTVRTLDIALSGAVVARGAARFDPAGNLQSLDVPSFRSGPNDDFSLNLSHDSVQGLVVTMNGRSFDNQDLLRRDAFEPQAQTATKSDPEPYHIIAKLDRLILRNDVSLSAFSLNASGVGSRPRAVTLSGQQSKNAEVTGTIVTAADGSHVQFKAADAGLLLEGLLGSTSLRGGALEVDAVGANANGGDYAGTLTISDFNMVDQPFLTRLMAAGSFGGFANLMAGKGVMVDKLSLPFALHGDVLTVREARATGPSLGLTADGYYDLKTNQLGLQGAFTPLYGINGIVDFIPILGTVLGSKKGEGLIGVTYSASGDAHDPKIFANPLSMLTPGIFRRIFQGSAPSAPAAQANSAPPQPPQKAQ